jgi:AraC-like DNA-binding protein
MPYVESRRACASRACYKLHSHPTYSIGSVDGGSSVFTGAGHAPVPLRPGTIVFVPSARPHACNPAPGAEWSYQMLHVDAAWLDALRSESADMDDRRLGAEPVRVVQERRIYRKFSALNEKLFSRASVSEKDAALIEFFADCDYEAGLALPSPASTTLSNTERMEAVLRCLDSESHAVPSLAELAAAARMSRYQLIRTFRNFTGMTPHAWHLSQRINRARQYLRAGMPLADVAYRLGFADQSHFQRTFKAYAAATPNSYRG